MRIKHAQKHNYTHKHFNVYFYSSGTRPSLHERITWHADRASLYASMCKDLTIGEYRYP